MFLIYDFAVVGGDRRLFYLANFLEEKNFKVVGFGLVNLIVILESAVSR